jgi:hypothetical protein
MAHMLQALKLERFLAKVFVRDLLVIQNRRIKEIECQFFSGFHFSTDIISCVIDVKNQPAQHEQYEQETNH